ncbi:hypothetical protein CNMCM8980_004719 [Aspergillus fumigatiaffinis]|uniref:DUF3431 domain-containing protein n=1 Tax=Aspergillus fumigatiaffinis TaxID=340414 RepID=A0A8H4GFH5_9EURO|nr:hypothetical protein CNMCM5878_004697 [Aspergillus fumigatiaffinis]KAF4215531.1 hypothetical protein CNMCM6457_005872 [Aspergillus fumigatiaffinis]KAF4226559.1 hypothetical protein CNMCM6805_004405 [Aspergillus fumigatiaffinis]KAF4232722.1 hypothetical protein CNMCM8980_004719 [Aspergillus fumigatiaffinis]
MTRQALKSNVLCAALLFLIAVFALSLRLSLIQGQSAQTGNVPPLADGHSKGAPARAEDVRNGDKIQPTQSVSPARRPAITDLVPAQKPPSAQWTIDEEFHRDGVIVMGRLESEDVRWVMKELPDWQHAIYTVDDPNARLRVKKNKGREANVYLQYIIDHYHKLPATIIFLHSHRGGIKGWHTEFPDHSNVRTVRMLNVDFVQRNGYANLRCGWFPGCPDEVQPFREPRNEERHAEHAFPDAWHYFFNGTKVPEVVAVACCAQFAVSRKQILERPLSDYLRYHQWVMETPWDDDTSGRVMEYMWHIIFGKEPVQ